MMQPKHNYKLLRHKIQRHNWVGFKLNKSGIYHQLHCEAIVDVVRELLGKKPLYKEEGLQINVKHYNTAKEKIKHRLRNRLNNKSSYAPQKESILDFLLV